jgi:hypothetical protein
MSKSIAFSIATYFSTFLMVTLSFVTAQAGNISSVYSKLNFENGCVWDESLSQEEAQMGGNAICDGLEGYPVYFAEDDLRQFTAYGPVEEPMMFPNGFSEWNSVHDTIEWRLENEKPFATIHRWFLDNIDPQTGSAEPGLRGQVLAISTVGEPEAPAGKQVSCTAGYVDALANKNANLLAREVADTVGRYFLCGKDRPRFHGKRGNLSGTPNDLE